MPRLCFFYQTASIDFLCTAIFSASHKFCHIWQQLLLSMRQRLIQFHTVGLESIFMTSKVDLTCHLWNAFGISNAPTNCQISVIQTRSDYFKDYAAINKAFIRNVMKIYANVDMNATHNILISQNKPFYRLWL